MAKSKSNDTPTFADFWAAYPVHKDRKRAEQAWQRLTASDRQAAIAALPGYVADCQQNGIQYKYAQGWLNGRRWEDEVAEPQAQPDSKFFVSKVQSSRGVIATKRGLLNGNDLEPETLNLEPDPTPPYGMETW